MPLILFQHILDEQGQLLLWQASETTDDLRAKFHRAFPEQVLPSFKLEKREREFIAGRLLLQLVLPGCTIENLANGKPVVNGGRHISFSHSDQLVGLAVAARPVGLDIQTPNEKILRIAGKFCNPQELRWLETVPDALEGVLAIWSAKEAVFKVFGEHVEFANDMTTHLRSPKQSQFMLSYKGKHGQHVFDMHQMLHQQARIIYTMLGEERSLP